MIRPGRDAPNYALLALLLAFLTLLLIYPVLLGGASATILGAHMDILRPGRFCGVVLVEALHLYPIIYLNAAAALANLDPALDEAAQSLGARPWRRFFRITLPLVRPGLFAGAT